VIQQTFDVTDVLGCPQNSVVTTFYCTWTDLHMVSILYILGITRKGLAVMWPLAAITAAASYASAHPVDSDGGIMYVLGLSVCTYLRA